MKWLDSPRDPAEAALRRGLDEASRRTPDEITLRRLWSRVADPALPTPAGPVRPWLVRAALAVAVGAGVAGALLVWPRGIAETKSPVAALPQEPTTAAVAPSVPEALPETAPRRLVGGPTVIRTGARERALLIMADAVETDLEANSLVVVDAAQKPSVSRGRVSFAVPRRSPRAPFAVKAGPYVISVLGTKFHVRVAGPSVGVDVEDGSVEVRRGRRSVRLEAGESWTSPLGRSAHRPEQARRRSAAVLRSPAPAAPPQAAAPTGVLDDARSWQPPQPMLPSSTAPAIPSPLARDRFREAQVALAAGRPERAIVLLEPLARGAGAAAENAAYEIGRVYREHLLEPRRALAAWNHYRSRFPRGLLRAEADLSVIETLLALGDSAEALAEAEAFLTRHPGSERRADVARVRQRLLTPAPQGL